MRDKQIVEMTKDLCDIQCNGMRCNICDTGCEWRMLAIALYNAGYRKASDVAREIFEEIEKIEKRLLNRQKKCDKEAQKAGWYLEVREAYEGQSEGIGLCLDYLAELKKKYLGEDINAPTKESEGEG